MSHSRETECGVHEPEGSNTGCFSRGQKETEQDVDRTDLAHSFVGSSFTGDLCLLMDRRRLNAQMNRFFAA